MLTLLLLGCVPLQLEEGQEVECTIPKQFQSGMKPIISCRATYACYQLQQPSNVKL